MYCPDHPVIRNLELTGYPDGKEPNLPICPICGEECEDVYYNIDNEIVGCDQCLTRKDASECNECNQDDYHAYAFE